MRLGIMQPYFFPHLGHFSLIANVDQWIVFDITQYTPKTWMNRNRILHPSEGWNYVTIPLRNSSQSVKTHEAKVLDIKAAHNQVVGKMSHYKKRAPHFSDVKDLVDAVFLGCEDDSLVQLNVRALEAVCRYLGLCFNYRICSELDLPLPENMTAGSWAPTISSLLGAKQYLNPIGGRDLFDPDHFRQIGIELQFLEASPFIYDTSPYKFESGLSILDVLMWNEPTVILNAVYNSRIITA